MDAIFTYIVQYVVEYSYIAVFVFLLWCGVGFPLPEDVILVAAGYLVYIESANLYWMSIVAFLGVMAGDLFIYYVGRRFGLDIISHQRFRRILSERRLVKIEKAFNRYGTPLVFFGRFLAFVRTPVYLSSGALGISWFTFILYDGLAALVSVPLVIMVGFYFGEHIKTALGHVRQVEHIFMAFVLLAVLYIIRWKRGRIRKLKEDEATI